MPIQEQNIVFLESERMDDVPEGGGAATGNVVVDGEMNNVFEDISDLDRTLGRFNLRKLFVAVRALNTDLYGGSKNVLTKLPEDDTIVYTLFTTNDAFDTRSQAVNRVEAYLFKAPLWNGYLHENHIAGMRSIALIQRVGTPLPPIGKTLCLVEQEGTGAEKEQYVRVIDVDVTETLFWDGGADFTRWVVQLELSDALRFDFLGHEATRSGPNTAALNARTRVRDTTVADATRYYGAHHLVNPAAIGDRDIRAASMFTQLVPSSATETPLANQITVGAVEVTLNAGDGHTVTIPQAAQTLFRPVTAENRRVNWIETLAVRPAPGTLSVSFMSQGNWYLLQDTDGDGTISGADPQFGGGTINYETRTVSVTLGALPDAGSQIMWAWGAPVHYTQRTTANITPPVWEARLGEEELEDDIALVEPGSVTVTWEAGGVTKTLTDDGEFFLEGDGFGVINYQTGAMWFRPELLPDSQTTPVVTYRRATTRVETFNPTADGNGFITVNLAHTPVLAGSVVCEWETIRTQTATERTRDEVGHASYLTANNSFNDSNAQSDENSWERPNTRQAWTGPYVLGKRAASDNASISSEISTQEKTAMRTKAKERSFAETKDSETQVIVIRKNAFDDGNGEIIGSQAGTVDYATGETRWYPLDIVRSGSFGVISGGAVSLDESTSSSTQSATSIGSATRVTSEGPLSTTTAAGATAKSESGTSTSTSSGGTSTAEQGNWGSETFSDSWSNGSLVRVRYVEINDTFDEITETLPERPIQIIINPYNAEIVVPQSVRFTLGGVLYRDDGLGSIILDGTGADVGNIDYMSGTVTLNAWTGGVNPTVELLSCLTQFGMPPVVSVSIRTAVAPLVPEAFQVTATSIFGDLLIGTGDANGEITGDSVLGRVNYNFGIAQIAFGYFDEDPEDPSGPDIWFAVPVDPSTVRYNAVGIRYLPLPADILGIDAVRLPADGRVPIYRQGDVVMVMHPLTTAPITPTINTPVSLGRTRIAWIRVLDANDDTVTEGYELDRINGTVTFTELPEHLPVTIRHTVADMRLVIDAQITGQLTLNRELTHEFPAHDSLVGSCLLFGDRRARVSATWDQVSWNGTWSDSQVGNSATATLNLIDFPITVTNEGADTDRWVLRVTNAGSNQWELISEKRGLVWTGTYAPGGDNIAPINPRTRTWDVETSQWIGGTPYMIIPGDANGGGWATGNIVRINTVGAISDFWMARSVQQSEIPLEANADCVEVYALGNVDRP